jgi:hypothetical protein
MTLEVTIMNINLTELRPEQTEAMLDAQKEFFGAYEDAGRAWLARVQSEVDLWSGLAARLTATRSVPFRKP